MSRDIVVFETGKCRGGNGCHICTGTKHFRVNHKGNAVTKIVEMGSCSGVGCQSPKMDTPEFIRETIAKLV